MISIPHLLGLEQLLSAPVRCPLLDGIGTASNNDQHPPPVGIGAAPERPLLGGTGAVSNKVLHPLLSRIGVATDIMRPPLCGPSDILSRIDTSVIWKNRDCSKSAKSIEVEQPLLKDTIGTLSMTNNQLPLSCSVEDSCCSVNSTDEWENAICINKTISLNLNNVAMPSSDKSIENTPCSCHDPFHLRPFRT